MHGVEAGEFPRYVAPHQPFVDMQSISWEIASGLHAEMEFQGDVFEMEDQRNWTDASYKTYSTALRIPYPVEVREGSVIRQSVRISLHGTADAADRGAADRSSDQPVRFTARKAPSCRLPRIGLGSALHGMPLSQLEAERLKALHLAHLRTDVVLGDPDPWAGLTHAIGEAAAIDVPLEIAISAPAQDSAADVERKLLELAARLGRSAYAVGYWMAWTRYSRGDASRRQAMLRSSAVLARTSRS